MMGYSRYPRVGWGVQFNDGLWVIEHRLGEKHCGIWQLLKGNAIIWEYLEVNVSQAGGFIQEEVETLVGKHTHESHDCNIPTSVSKSKCERIKALKLSIIHT